MRAVVKTKKEKGNVKLKEIDIPRIGPDEVLIKSKAAPIGSDVRVYESDPVMMRVTRPPVVIGSENSGEIVEVGNHVTGWRAGDRVVCELVVSSCGHCSLCKQGRPFMCLDVITLGRGRDGSFADYFAAPAGYLHRVPDSVSFEEAAMAEDLGVVITAIDDHQAVRLGDRVAVLGPGPIGLLSLQVAKASGAGQILVSGIESDTKRLEMARQLGADITLNIEREALEKHVEEVSNGEGVDVVIVATGAAVSIEQAFHIIKKYGTMVVLGFPGGPLEVRWHEVTTKALKIVGGWGASSSIAWEKALKCIAGGLVNVRSLITHKFPLDEWQKAFETFSSCEGLKVQLIP